ncbi:MAG: Ig-like domain repeat protein [Candidatus Omnitrophica bacterium]|nr:Ig-like domain repeat protein [Candidatus Omnitrophota bacterium]
MEVKPRRSQKGFYFRLTTWAVLITFSTLQIAWAQGPEALKPAETIRQAPIDPKSISQEDWKSSSQTAKPVDQKTSTDYLMDDFPLTRADKQETEGEAAEKRALTRQTIQWEKPRITYYSNGRKKSWQRRGTENGKLKRRELKTYDPQGKITRDLDETYHPNGRVAISDDRRYLAGVLDKRTYKTFNTQGRLTRTLFRDYDPHEKLRILDDTSYTNGHKTGRHRNEYDSSGIRLSYLRETFFSGESLKTSDSYRYSSGRLTQRTYQERDASGNQIVSQSRDYTAPLYTNLRDFVFEYAVDGSPYTESFSFTAEGSTRFQTTKAGYLGAEVKLDIEIIFDETPPGAGSVALSGNAVYSRSASVSLTLEVDDNWTTDANIQMAFSQNGGQTFGAFEAFNTQKTLALEGSDGTKEVIVRFKDEAGNTLDATDTIHLDRAIPTGSININSGSSYTTSTAVTLNLAAQDSGSGIDKMSFSQDNTAWTAPEAYNATKNFTLPSGDGTKTLRVKFYDKAGNESQVYSKSITLDSTLPDGSITINNSNLYTSSPTVTLALSANDPTSGVADMRFSNNFGFQWSDWEPFGTRKDWTLSSTNGERWVAYEVRDWAGNIARLYDSIILDTLAPTGSLNINSGAVYTGTPTVTLNLSAQDSGSGIDKVSFSQDNTTWTAPEVYNSTKTFTLPSGDGNKTVYLKYYDKAGNVSAVYSKSIILDTLPPSGTVRVKNSVQFVNQRFIDLEFSASDAGSGLDWVRVSNDNSTLTEIPYTTLVPGWALLEPDGVKTIYVQFKDKFGRWSSLVTTTVTLDRVKPGVSAAISSGKTYSNSSPVIVNLLATDDRSAGTKLQMRFAVDGTAEGSFNAWESLGSQKSIKLPEVDGSHTVFAEVRDEAGNINQASVSITLDRTAPTGGVKINNGADRTGLRKVTLTLDAQDASTQVEKMRISEDGGASWTPWQDFSNQIDWTFGGLEGTREIRVEVGDSAGNTATFSDTIELNTSIPQIAFTSPSSTGDSLYTLRYKVDGVERSETWRLAPGANPLLVRVSEDGRPPAFAKFTVTLNQSEPARPLMPNAPTLAEDLISVTTEGGLVLKYDNSVLVAMEKPGEYQLYLPEVDGSGNLTGGLVRFSEGGEIYYGDGKVVWRKDPQQNTYYYNPDGSVREVAGPEGQRSVFSYRLDSENGKVMETLVSSSKDTSLYDATGRLLLTLKINGDVVHYDGGILDSVERKGTGEVLHYGRTDDPKTGEVTVSVTGSATPFQEYPSRVRYDREGQILEVVEPDGTQINFKDGLPTEKIEFIEGEVRKTSYQYKTNPLEDLIGLQISGTQLKRSFDAQGRLGALETDGVELKISGNLVESLTLLEGSEGGFPSGTTVRYEERNSLKRALVSYPEPDARKLTYEVEEGGDRYTLREIQLPDGTIQRFRPNGSLGSLETSDGRIYEYEAAPGGGRSFLKEWRLADGRRLYFKKKNPDAPLQLFLVEFPDGRRIENITFDPEGRLNQADERVPERGAVSSHVDHYESGRLVKRSFPDTSELLFNEDGIFYSYRDPRGETYQVREEKGPQNETTGFRFEGSRETVVYSREGVLTRYLSNGVSFEFDREGKVAWAKTVFGEIQNPLWNEAQELISGRVSLADGSRYFLEGGKIARILRSDGLEITYTGDRAARLVKEDTTLLLEYITENTGLLKGAFVRYETEGGLTSDGLINFLIRPERAGEAGEVFDAPLENLLTSGKSRTSVAAVHRVPLALGVVERGSASNGGWWFEVIFDSAEVSEGLTPTLSLAPNPFLNHMNLGYQISESASEPLNDLINFGIAGNFVLNGGRVPLGAASIGSRKGFPLNYDVSPPGSSVGFYVSYDADWIEGIETRDFSGLGEVVLKTKGELGTVLTLELTDRENRRSRIFLRGIDNSERFFNLDFSLFQGVDITHIKSVSYILEGDRQLVKTGTLDIQWGSPFVALSPQPELDSTSGVELPQFQWLHVVPQKYPAYPQGVSDKFVTTRSSDSEMEFHFEGASDYYTASAVFDYDLANTKDVVEYKDLSAFAGLLLGSERAVEGINFFSIQDAHGNRARVRLFGNAGTPNFYFLDLDKMGIDLRRVRSLAFVYNDPKVEDGRVWLRGIPREGPVPFPAVNPDTDELAILADETVTVAVNPGELVRSDYLSVSIRPPPGVVDSKAVLTLGEAVYRTETLSDDWSHLVIPLAKFSGAQADSLQISFEGSTREGSYLIDNLVLMRFQDNSASTLLPKLRVTAESLSQGERTHLPDLAKLSASFVSEFSGRNETPARIHSELGALTSVVTDIFYDSNGQIKEVKTGDGKTLVMAEEGLQQALFSQGVTVDYGSGPGNEPQSLTVAGPGGNQAPLSASYQYGRIREVRRSDGSRLQYGYEFIDGAEITVVKTPLGTEPETYEIKRYHRDPGNPYQIGQLLSVEEPTGLLTVYEYGAGSGGPEAPLKLSRTYYKGRLRSEFSYEYREGRTFVTDQEGTVTEYDSDGRLRSHTTPDGFRYEHLFEDENFRVIDGRSYLNGKLIRLETEGFTIEEAVTDSEGFLTEALLLYQDGHRTFFVKGAPYLTTRDVGEATFFDPAKDGENPGFQNEMSNFRLAQTLWKGAPKSPAAEILPEKVEVVRLVSRESDEISAEYREGRLEDLRFKEDGMEVTGLSYDRDGELDGARIKLDDGTGFLFQEGLHVIRSRSNEVVERLTPWDPPLAYRNESERWERLKMQSATFVRSPDETGRSKKTDLGMALYDETGRILEIHLRAEGVILRDFEFNDRGKLVRAKVFSGGEETTEYREGLSLSYQGGDGRPGKVFSLFDEGNFHYESARSRWKVWKEKISEYLLDPAFVFETELDSEGMILTLTKANQSVSVYEKGKVDQVFDQEGRLLITNRYDPLEGMLISITMVDARRRLEEDTFEARRDLRRQKVLALEKLARDTDLATQALRDQFEGPRKILLAQRANVESLLANLEATKVRGKQGKREKSGALDQIRGALHQIESALSELDRKYAEAIESLSQKAAEVASQIESETGRALQKLEKTRADYLAEILRQEIAPVLHDLYRNALGRDPGEEETREAIREKETGTFDSHTLRAKLLRSAEYQARLDEVNRIREGVRETLALYLAGRYSATDELGLTEKEVVSLTSEEADQILQWLDGHDLHFGHSAFLAMESLLRDEGRNVSLRELAARAILIDIFSGVIGPFEEGELKLSLFALERTARFYGVTFYPAEVSYEELRQMVLGGKKVMVHLKGDHYTVITGFETVSETQVLCQDGRPVEIQVPVEKVKTLERNKGAAGEEVVLTKEQFLDAWLQGEGEKGFVLSAVAADPRGTGTVLTQEKAQSVRGAFFFFIPFIISVLVSVIQAVIAVVIAVVAAVVAAVSAVISAVVGAISNLVTTLGRGLSYLARGFQAVGKFLFEGVRDVGKLLLKGLQFVGSRLYQGFQAVGHFLKEAALNLGGKLWQGMEKIATKLAQGFTKLFSKQDLTKLFSVKGGATSFKTSLLKNALGYGLNFSLSKGLDSLGIDFPGLNLLTSFVTGGIAGLTDNASSTSFFTSALKKLTLTGLSTLALHLDLPPPIANAISLVGATLVGATLDPSVTVPEALKDLAPTLTRDLTFQGILSVGEAIGLDPRLSALIGIPIRATVGSITGNALGVKGYEDLFGEITSQTIGGLVSVGSSIGLNAVGASPILQSFLPSFLGNFVAGFGGTPGGSDAIQREGENIFKKITDGIIKFGKGLASAVGNVTSFGTKVIEGGVNLVKQGFAKAVDFFSGVFDRRTQEALIQAGGGNIEQAILNNATIVNGTARASIDGVEIVWDSALDKLTYTGPAGVSAAFSKLVMDTTGNFGMGDFAYAETTQNSAVINLTSKKSYIEASVTMDDKRIVVESLGGRDLVSRTLGPFVRPTVVFESTAAENNYQIKVDMEKGGLTEVKAPWEYVTAIKDFFTQGAFKSIVQEYLKDQIEDLLTPIFEKLDEILRRK